MALWTVDACSPGRFDLDFLVDDPRSDMGQLPLRYLPLFALPSFRFLRPYCEWVGTLGARAPCGLFTWTRLPIRIPVQKLKHATAELVPSGVGFSAPSSCYRSQRPLN